MIVAARSSSRRRALDQATIAKIRQGLIESMSGDGSDRPRAYRLTRLSATLFCAEVNAANSKGNLAGLMSGAQGFKDVDINTHMSEYRKTVACVPGILENGDCVKEAATPNTAKSM
jgi:hypothetical protein